MNTRPWLIEQSYAGGAIEARAQTSHQTKLRKGILNCHSYEQGGNMDECKTNEAPSIQTLSYPGCIKAARLIAPFIRQFDVDSAACAIFCINSWHENRSSQNSAYTLNAALLSIDAFGTRQIADYKSFSAFFSRIKEALSAPCSFEDEVVPVMGQTLIPFRGKWHRALHGCGATLEYPRLCFASTIIDDPTEISEFEELLDYVDEMSQKLRGGEWQNSDAVPGDMQMPSCDYWYRTCRWMGTDPVSHLSADTIAAIDESTSYVENKCFLMNDDRTIPLFCPSILEDRLTRSMTKKRAEKNQAGIDVALLKQARAIFDSPEERGSSVLAFPLFLVNDKPIESCPSTFIVLDGESKATLFYNASAGHNDSGLEKLKALFRKDEAPLAVLDYIKIQGQQRKLVLKRPNCLDFTIIAYHDNVDLPPIPKAESRSRIADYDCGAADLMAILMMANDAGEICTFFQSTATSPNTILAPYVAASDYFIIWSDSNRQILDGTEDRRGGVALALDYNETDRYFAELFSDRLVDFPRDFNGEWALGSPFAYSLKKGERGFTEIVRKSDGRSCGLAKRIPGKNGQPCFIHLKADLESARNVPPEVFERNASAFPLFEDLLMCMTNDAGPEIAGLISDRGRLDLIYVMPGGSETNDLPVIDDELGIRALFIESDHPMVFYSAESETFCNAMSNAQDRSVECRFAGAVLSLAGSDRLDAVGALTSKLSRLSPEGKMVDVGSLSLPYRWRYGAKRITLDAASKTAALKAVAYAVDDEGVEPGSYFGADANRVIRRFQKALSKAFEEQLKQFDKEDLLIKIYEILASSSHAFHLDTKRYNSFSDLQDSEEKRVEEKIINQREDSRHEVRAAMFSIETLLTVSRHGNRIADASEVAKLVAVGGQLLAASDAADMLMFKPKGMGVEIADNCIATAIEDEDLMEESRGLKARQLRDGGHVGSDATEDEKHVRLAKGAFEADTGVSFPCFLDVLSTLSLGSSALPNEHYVSRNVMSIEKASMLDSIEQELSGIYDEAMIEKCVDFLTLDCEKLKEIDGQATEYLPFGKTKNRPNRIELKPLVEIDGRLVFSPIRTGLLRERWVRGIAERFIPAKAAFPSLNTVMENWKRRYEKALEKDVQNCFLREGFSQKHVFRGIDLCKKGDHPQQLGDYDGLAYDPSTETIWAIECKEFEKIESAYDYMQLQSRWFGEKGKLLKFERRIEYLRDNLDEVAADLGFEHTGTLHIRPYLVSNKLFVNTIGQSSFQVVTLSELESLLEEERSGAKLNS